MHIYYLEKYFLDIVFIFSVFYSVWNCHPHGLDGDIKKIPTYRKNFPSFNGTFLLKKKNTYYFKKNIFIFSGVESLCMLPKAMGPQTIGSLDLRFIKSKRITRIQGSFGKNNQHSRQSAEISIRIMMQVTLQSGSSLVFFNCLEKQTGVVRSR